MSATVQVFLDVEFERNRVKTIEMSKVPKRSSQTKPKRVEETIERAIGMKFASDSTLLTVATWIIKDSIVAKSAVATAAVRIREVLERIFSSTLGSIHGLSSSRVGIQTSRMKVTAPRKAASAK
jgi:hypothetical protein